jgi:hypothetical protein
LPEEEQIPRKTQIIYLRRQYELIHILIYATFNVYLLSSPFLMIVIFKMFLNINISQEITEIIHIEGWVLFLHEIRDFFYYPNLIFLVFWACITIILPILLIFKIHKYKNREAELPKIYLNFLPERFFISALYPYPLGMLNGLLFFYLFFIFLFYINENLIIAVIFGVLSMIICLYSYKYVFRNKNKEFKKKFLLGFIFYFIITLVVNISL